MTDIERATLASSASTDVLFSTRNRKQERKVAVIRWLSGFAVIAIALAILGLAGVSSWIWLLSLSGMVMAWIAFADRWMRVPGGIPILTWHSVSMEPDWLPWADAISVTPQTLESQLGILRSMGCEPMDTVDFVRRRQNHYPIPSNTVILHFDDGYLDNWIAAAPILQRHNCRATMFVSLDFIASDRGPQPKSYRSDAEIDWKGYLSWNEIRDLDRGAFGGVFGIEAHGVDHGRVVTSSKIVNHLTQENWRKLAWVQWAELPGDKSLWYQWDEPPAVKLGAPVYESDGALAARKWTEAGVESNDAFLDRVAADLTACGNVFVEHLGRRPLIFCWPQNLASRDSRIVAEQSGYLATTGGRGANREDEDPRILSRVHVGERVLGFVCPWIDNLHFRATVHSFRGNHYWYFPILCASIFHRCMTRFRMLRAST